MAQMQDEEIEYFEELVATYRSRLRVLDRQIASFGLHVPAHITLDREQAAQGLAATQAELRRLGRSTPAKHPPYVGLSTFQERDADLFYGRETLIAELVTKVERTSFLTVLGASGSGKSSVVRAGLIPELKGGALPGSHQWRYVTLKPGVRPLDTLATTLATLHGGDLANILALSSTLAADERALLHAADVLLASQDGARLVLVVDQAEELWTLAPAEPDARAVFVAQQQRPFIQHMLSALAAPKSPLLIILTLRADFLHHAAEHPKLAYAIGEHDVIVSPMSIDDLRMAITRPAEAAGGSFEPGLVEMLVEQTIGRPGALPLLEYTLLELWKDRRKDGVLTWDAFQRIGGVEGGLARRADTILSQEYTPEQQTELRALLLRLVQPGEGAVDTRRRVLLDDLVPVGGSLEVIHTLIRPLVDERLLTTGRDPVSGKETVEVSHEALIRAWPTLGTWINHVRADLRSQLQLEEAAKEWEASSESPDFLWSGLRLANAEAWIDRARPQLNARDQRFLDTCRVRRRAQRESEQAQIAAEEAARQRELYQARSLAASAVRLRRRAMYLGGALVTTLVVAVLAGWFWYSTAIAEQQALAQLLVAKGQAVYEDDPLLGVSLAIEGLAGLPQDDPARTDLISITMQLVKQGRIQKLAGDGSGIFPSPDGTMFVLTHTETPDELRHTTDGATITPLTGDVWTVTFSPDSRLFIVLYFNQPDELRRADGSIVTRLTADGEYGTFSPDSKLFVIQYSDQSTELRRADGSIVTRLTADGEYGTFSPDSKLFVIQYSDRPPELRRTDGSLITRFTDDTRRITFSPDGTLLEVSFSDQHIELRRADGSIIPLGGDAERVTFSPDSTLLMVSYANQPSELRRADGSIITSLTGTVWNAAFGPDSTLLVVSYANQPSELRRADGSIITSLTSGFEYIAFSPDSRLFVVTYFDQPDELRRADGSIITRFVGGGGVQHVAFSPDSTLFVVQYHNQSGELWETHGSTRRLATFTSVGSVAFDPKALRLIMQHTAGPVYILDNTWLSATAGYPETLSESELIKRTCAGPLSPSHFDEKKLQSHLGHRTPRSCA